MDAVTVTTMQVKWPVCTHASPAKEARRSTWRTPRSSCRSRGWFARCRRESPGMRLWGARIGRTPSWSYFGLDRGLHCSTNRLLQDEWSSYRWHFLQVYRHDTISNTHIGVLCTLNKEIIQTSNSTLFASLLSFLYIDLRVPYCIHFTSLPYSLFTPAPKFESIQTGLVSLVV